ncbi:hypothetical protein DFP72DRAFT_1167329 [Ephemerocybe angulata]|uniref:F-box domain-containing protein n=1 Tax=Ephemerocybe angulata TaxID=980116 RepID=A0A8H6MAP2_9AGAR|nr:hypothetical protein DFP72DRAFT_1167329 [Tulosesus angulatus]
MSDLLVPSLTSGEPTRGIHSLPNETLNQIFTSGSLTLSTNPATNTSPAFTLLLVCRNWRALAMALPPLWTTLDFDCCYLEKKWGRSTAEVLLWKFAQLCLSKSTMQPLDLTFCCHLIGAPMAKLAQFGATSDRWVSLTLVSNTLTAIVNDQKHFVGFPALRSMDIRMLSRPLGRISDYSGPIIDIGDDPDWEPFDGAALNLPSLKLLRVQLRMSLSHRIDAHDGFLGLPRAIGTGITHLTIINCAHLGTFSERMRAALTVNMTFLTHFHLHLSASTPKISNSLAPTQPSALTLPFVTHLFVDGGMKNRESCHDDAWRHLAFLRLPALTHLHISQAAPEDRDPSTDPHFCRFISECRQVRTLATRGVGLKHSMALLEALNPEVLMISTPFDNTPARAVLCNLFKDMLEGNQSIHDLHSIAVYDSNSSGALLAEDCTKLVEGSARLFQEEIGCDMDLRPKTIAIHSRVPPSKTFRTHAHGRAGSVVVVKLCFHMHPPCFLPQAADSGEWFSDFDCRGMIPL